MLCSHDHSRPGGWYFSTFWQDSVNHLAGSTLFLWILARFVAIIWVTIPCPNVHLLHTSGTEHRRRAALKIHIILTACMGTDCWQMLQLKWQHQHLFTHWVHKQVCDLYFCQVVPSVTHNLWWSDQFSSSSWVLESYIFIIRMSLDFLQGWGPGYPSS